MSFSNKKIPFVKKVNNLSNSLNNQFKKKYEINNYIDQISKIDSEKRISKRLSKISQLRILKKKKHAQNSVNISTKRINHRKKNNSVILNDLDMFSVLNQKSKIESKMNTWKNDVKVFEQGLLKQSKLKQNVIGYPKIKLKLFASQREHE